MKEFDALIKVIEKLRSRTGCPWDRAQTHKSLKPYIIEESYEVLSAIDSNDPEKLKDELGDLLLQVVLHAQIGKEKKNFRIEDIISSISTKMVRRHPHVFSKTKVSGVDEVWKNWEEIKRTETVQDSVLDSVPEAMPGLYRAEKLQKKAARVGFDWDNVAGAWDKVEEEMEEVKEILKGKDKDKNKKKLEEEIGDLIFAVVNVARKSDISTEDALSSSIKKFIRRFKHVEKGAKKQKRRLHDMKLSEMDKLWDEAKKKERHGRKKV